MVCKPQYLRKKHPSLYEWQNILDVHQQQETVQECQKYHLQLVHVHNVLQYLAHHISAHLGDIIVQLANQNDIPGKTLRTLGFVIGVYLVDQDPGVKVYSGFCASAPFALLGGFQRSGLSPSQWPSLVLV